ncbi:protein MFI isoform X1 [Gopherus flavomarginatus]|uniref:protein MFI isoform X1 n=1 Tax=Gopherus flavomarginatus TaxID=286002 RepID=UPI0021CC200F|nr:protein MFI isoform X1 [Gopherus flavomarginatus]
MTMFKMWKKSRNNSFSWYIYTSLQNVRVFRYYKELIGFRGVGDPHLLMKFIDPREAELLDAAAGVYVRFRLGGTKYPPSIYYKIFTHRPIVDMCANSPKDYTKPTYKQLLPKAIHGKIWKDDHSGWYKRVENNGWRLLSIRFWRTIDPVTDEDNTKEKEFHYSKLKRKQDIDQRRKRRKIEWMTKMYYAGSLRVKTEDPTTAILVQRSAEGIINAVEKGGTDNVMEWEVDELLEWTNALNFEEYISQWKEIATSNSSANYQGFQFIVSEHDLCEFSQLSHGNIQDTPTPNPLPLNEIDFKSGTFITPLNSPCNLPMGNNSE